MSDISFDKARLAPHAVKFLATFLRFEFALKEACFGLENGDAQVDWGRVTIKLGVPFFLRIKESGRADTLMKKPPKKQIAHNYALEWEQKAPPKTIADLFEAVRRVRNNLVHGGKSGDPEYDADDPRRNENLIREAQWIVEQALHELPDVRGYFEGRY
jgi:hypothetical protein